MNDSTRLPDDLPAVPADETAPAPKRRRTRAAASAEAVASEATASAEPAVEPLSAEVPPPKRRARKTVASAAVEGEAAPVVQAELGFEGMAAAPAAPRPRRSRAAASTSPADTVDVPLLASDAGRPEASPPAAITGDGDARGEPLSSAPQGPAEPVEQLSAEPVEADASSGDAEPGRRDRKRRRRGPRGDREPGVEGGQGAQGDAALQAGDPSGTDPRLARPAPPVAEVAERFEDVISGQFDQDTDTPADIDAAGDAATEEDAGTDAADPGKRVLRPEPEAPKLHKVLAAAGIGSRRDMEALIEEGQVTVNGEVAHQGMRITWGDQVKVSGRPVKVRIAPAPARVLAYHKPVGEVVTHHDPEGRPTVFKSLPRLPQGKWLSVGRLDLNTEGLLLFTNSGELSNQLMHPRFGVEREYAVRVLGELTLSQRQQLLDGVEIEGQKAGFQSIEDGGGSEGANHWWRVVITEGRNREVRKLFDAVGLTVSRLIRIRYGTVVLPRGLKRGVWVELDDNDVRQIRRLAGGDARRPQGGAGGQPQASQPHAGAPQGGFNSNPKGGKQPKQPPPQRGRHGPGQPHQGPGQGGYSGQQGAGGPQQSRGPKQGPYGAPPRGPRGHSAPGNGPAPYDDDQREADDPPFIPNPLEQTFDRRFATGTKRIVAGFGRPGDDSRSGGQGGPRAKGEPRQPDPMQTSVGYIGADAYFGKPGGGGGGGGGGGQNKRGRRR